MSKTCAFLGNDYDFMHGRTREHNNHPEIQEKVRKEVIKLIENEDVTTFFVGEIGGFEVDAYDAVLDVKKNYPQIQIVLVISKITELHEVGLDASNHIHHKRYCDEWIYPDKCASGYKRLCIVYRNRYIIENTDFIIAYNRYKGRSYELCKQAQNKGIRVIELADEN